MGSVAALAVTVVLPSIQTALSNCSEDKSRFPRAPPETAIQISCWPLRDIRNGASKTIGEFTAPGSALACGTKPPGPCCGYSVGEAVPKGKSSASISSCPLSFSRMAVMRTGFLLYPSSGTVRVTRSMGSSKLNCQPSVSVYVARISTSLLRRKFATCLATDVVVMACACLGEALRSPYTAIMASSLSSAISTL